jgi:hypothetical protein
VDPSPRKQIARIPAPQPVPAAQAQPVVHARTAVGAPQPALRVSSPREPAEREAEAVARKVLRAPAPAPKPARARPVVPLASPSVARFADALALMRAAARPERQPDAPVELDTSKSAGQPLPASVRGFMEPRFRADFSGVVVHTDDAAARLSRQLQAQAFTLGNHIYFGRGRWRPDSADGRELIAHELTHTIQQRAAVQRSPDGEVHEREPPHVQRLGMADVLGYLARKADVIPGFRMFSIVLGVNPIDMSPVERGPANILRAAAELLPGGALLSRALAAHGVFERAGRWIEQQLQGLGLSGAAIRRGLDALVDSLGWSDLLSPEGVWTRARGLVAGPIDRVTAFIRGLGGAVLTLLKDAVLAPLAALAGNTPGWALLCAVLGQDPISGAPVARSAEALIGGFMRLVGQEEVWDNLRRAGAVPRAWAWFQGASQGLISMVREIPGLFRQALAALDVADLVQLPAAFGRVGRVFAGFLARFREWGSRTVWDLLEIVFSVLVPGAMTHLRKAAAAFRSILADPVRFVGNLVRAGLLGLRQFAGNFVRHLGAALVGWLTGALGGAGIHVPQDLSPRELVRFVLSALGLTWQSVRPKLVRAVGEPALAALETGFDLVRTLVTQGPAAAWERVLEGLTDLKELVLGQIMSFVQERVVRAAIEKLVTSLNPAGAFIQAVIAIYNTVMFFVERMQQIGQVAAAFVDSIAAIAAGAIADAATKVETTMAGLLTLVISFLARIAGLGRVGDAVTNIVQQLRAPIDRALDRVVAWIVQQARKLGKLLGKADPAAAPPAAAIVVPVPMNGTTHTIRVDPETRTVTLASEQPGSAHDKLKAAEAAAKELPANKLSARALKLISELKAKLEEVQKFLTAGGTGFTDHIREINVLLQIIKTEFGAYADAFKIHDVTDPLPRFGPATAGEHPVDRPSKQDPDGSPRESHHVPPFGLAVTLQKVLEEMSSKLSKSAIGESVARWLEARVKQIKSKYDDRGTGLSAISLNTVTHRNSGGAAVHSRAAADDIIRTIAALEDKRDTATFKVMTKGNKKLAVNPQVGTWENWLVELRKELDRRGTTPAGTVEEVIASARSEAAALDRDAEAAALRSVQSMVEALLDNAFKEALRHAFAAVTNALASSLIDGTPTEKTAALDQLNAIARDKWKTKGIIAS